MHFCGTLNLHSARVSVHCVQMWQIRNPSLWRKYQVHKRMMNEKLKRDTERWLWHGAAENAIDSINKEGFNRSYSGLNGTRTPASSAKHLQRSTRYSPHSLSHGTYILTYEYIHTHSFSCIHKTQHTVLWPANIQSRKWWFGSNFRKTDYIV